MRWQAIRDTNIKEDLNAGINFITYYFDNLLAGMEFTLTFATLILNV